MKLRLLVAAIGTVAVLLPGCSGEEILERDRFGESGPVVAGDADPLKHALETLGLVETDLRRPVVNEEDYRALARLPLIDQLSRSPFMLQQWAETTSQNLQTAAEFGIAGIFPAAVETINGGVRYPAQHPASIPANPRLAEALHHLFRRYQTPLPQTIIEQVQRAGIAPAFERELARLVIAMTDAALLLDQAFADLSAADVAQLSQRPELFFYPDGLTFNFLTAPTHTQTRLLAIAQKIDFVAAFTAAARITASIDDFIRNHTSDGRRAQFIQDDSPSMGILLDIPTPLGSIVLAGGGDDHHDRTGALIVDIGGNDTYRPKRRPDAARPGRISILIDLKGNDVHGREGDRAVQGFGNLSVDLLVDLQGNDRYRAGDLAQGCGVFGVGILADYSGNDDYAMGVMGQGFGLFGVGILLDRRGRDRYTVTGLAQGVGSTMGAGILCDGGGNDKYLADRNRIRGQLPPDDWSHVQGAGLSVRSPDWGRQASLYGGVGFLSDGRGDDFYYSSNESCMGASYFLSIGALVDHAGSDWYIPAKGLGLGWAIHMGSAVFVDHRGDDRYYGNLLSGGAASDRSIAIMVDHSGNDVYGPTEEYGRSLVMEAAQKTKQPMTEEAVLKGIRETLAQNAYASARKPKALGILIDYRGNDRYTANPEEFGQSFGGLIPPVEPQDWSHAVLIDLGGQDTYSHPGRRNNRYYKWMGHSICYDTESSLPAVGIKRLPGAPDANLRPETDIGVSAESEVYRSVVRLHSPDVFRRFSARGRILERSGPAAIEELLLFLKGSDADALNREILEVMDAMLFAGKIPGGPRNALLTLLEASDPNVRIFSAGKLGRWKIRSALKHLKRMGKDPDEAVRIQAIRAIGRIAPGDAVGFLLETGKSDPSRACRREAFLALSSWATGVKSSKSGFAEKVSASMITALEDKDEVIRTAASTTLACCATDAAVTEALKRRLLDESVYVQRAAAKSLIRNGFKTGIPALIETLRFPSIDTRQHYDHELAIDLAFFCGIDFPAETRYEYETWKNWWDKNKETIDLNQNLRIRHQIERAFAAETENDGIAIFEELRNRHPQNSVIVNRYAQFCSHWIKMRLLTRKNVDRQVLQRSLRLQQILTQLQPDNAERWAGLAYFQYRLGNYRLALVGMETALQLDPDNSAYREKRDAYRLLLQEHG